MALSYYYFSHIRVGRWQNQCRGVVSVSSGIGRTEVLQSEISLKWKIIILLIIKISYYQWFIFVHTKIYLFLFWSNFHVFSCCRPKMNFEKCMQSKKCGFKTCRFLDSSFEISGCTFKKWVTRVRMSKKWSWNFNLYWNLLTFYWNLFTFYWNLLKLFTFYWNHLRTPPPLPLWLLT